MFCIAVADEELSLKGILTRIHTVVSSLPSPLGKYISTLEGIGRKQQVERTTGCICFCFVFVQYFAKRFCGPKFQFQYKQQYESQVLVL